MATHDVSRSAFDARKHYASVRMQQGRVLIDDDWNEAESIEMEERRRALVEIVGPTGSPDEGFRIAEPKITGGQINFTIRPGTFYVAGLRVDLEQVETFRTQRDWLQQSVQAPTAPGGDRHDLVYLEAWQQAVQAVEDRELFEVALGGPDTSTRLRSMRRVRVAVGIGRDNCREAWDELVASWSRDNIGTLTADHELRPDVQLAVSFDTGGTAEDLCAPAAQGGYLGAENQAIRVQVVDADHFVWGFDNASALYRVTVEADGKTLTVLTEPRDAAHWPLSGQIVEILPWSAVLPNGEKVAEARGQLSRVDSSYNPDTRNLTLADALPPQFGEAWRQRPDAAQLGASFLFMRVWDRGADRTSDARVAFTSGGPVALGKTGLRIAISGPHRRPGDHWIIAARPETPNRVVPWQLESGRPPHGYRRFFAPLALIRWTGSAAGVQGQIVDECRATFPPLTDAQHGSGMSTGVVVFTVPAQLGGQEMVSGLVDPGLGSGPIGVVLGLEQQAGGLIFAGPVDVFQSFNFPQMFLGAEINPGAGRFRIALSPQDVLPPVIRVRWWAFKPGRDMGEVTVVSVEVSPTAVNLQPGLSHQFTATVNGTIDQTVTWKVNEIPDGNAVVGTIDGTGLYTAPTAVTGSTAFTVRATSQADPSKSGTATVAVTPLPVVSVAVSPTAVRLLVNQTQQFTAVVTGTTTSTVAWKVNNIAGGNTTVGTIGPNGLYTAPASVPVPDTVTVSATSSADANKSASAAVTIAPAVAVAISPTLANLDRGEKRQFTATVGGSADTRVNWSVTELAGGTIDAQGLYTAPSNKSGTFHVRATSVADPNKGATATVKVKAKGKDDKDKDDVDKLFEEKHTDNPFSPPPASESAENDAAASGRAFIQEEERPSVVPHRRPGKSPRPRKPRARRP